MIRTSLVKVHFAMIFTEQIKAARMLLHWDQSMLADRAGLAISTVKKLEAKSGLAQGHAETIWKLQRALEEAGIVFINEDDSGGPGVRLRQRLTD